MKKTVDDLAYSRSPECPFVINEKAMGDFRRFVKYTDDKTLLPPDAQDGVKKSIAAALKGRKIHAVMHLYPVDAGHIANGFVGTPPAVRRWD